MPLPLAVALGVPLLVAVYMAITLHTALPERVQRSIADINGDPSSWMSPADIAWIEGPAQIVSVQRQQSLQSVQRLYEWAASLRNPEPADLLRWADDGGPA